MRGWNRGWGGEAGCEDEGTEEEEVMAVGREREQGGEGSGSVSGVDSFEEFELCRLEELLEVMYEMLS